MSKNTDSAEMTKTWYKTWWGVPLIIAIFPIAISYWVTTQKWERNNKILAIGVIWMIFFYMVGTNKIKNLEEKQTQVAAQVVNATTQPTPTATSVSSETPTPLPSPTSTPTPTPEPTFDPQFGNNYLAAQKGEEFYNVLEEALPGAITKVYIELAPEKIDKSEADYLNSVSSIFFQITINSSLWSSMNETQQKDIVVSMVNSAHNMFPHGFPHIYMSNGNRQVAEGSLSIFGDIKVELK